MTKPTVQYLLCFFAGSIFTLAAGGLLAFDPAPWRWNASGLIESQGRDVVAWMPDPMILVGTAVSLLALALAWVYWRRRALRRPGALKAAAINAGEGSPNEQDEVNAVRVELERQLGRLIVLIAGQLEKSKNHVASLKDVNAHLASVTTVTELRNVVRALITSNETNERQTRDLEARLKEAQDQTSVLRQRLTQAEKLASLDPLTSVANRRRFEQFICSEVDKSHARGTPLCLIMTDIDHFKRVNDRHGHAAGDRVLKSFADLLAMNVREGDLVARYGGEEFAVILPETPTTEAFLIAERIRCMLELYGGPDASLVKEFGRLTASFGVAEIRDGEPPSTLIQRTDQVLYEAKSKGRNRTMVWSTAGISDGAKGAAAQSGDGRRAYPRTRPA